MFAPPENKGTVVTWAERHISRALNCDTAFPRLIVAIGLMLLGGTMLAGMGAGQPGYRLLESSMAIPYWGAIYLAGGIAGVLGALSERLSYWLRICVCVLGMYLWVFLCVAQFADQALPTRTLLLLPATVEVLVLIKVVALGKRSCG
jgi:hypothetical protein